MHVKNLLEHLRGTGQVQWETMRVGSVPVEHVEFRMSHGVNVSLDG